MKFTGDDIAEVSSLNPLYAQLKKDAARENMGLMTDFSKFEYLMKRADRIVTEHPEILEKFYIKVSPVSGKDLRGPKINKSSLIQTALYYRANPWRFAHEVIGLNVINKTTPRGVVFKHFTYEQKMYLRAVLDMRKPKVIATCNRGGAKTWLNAISIALFEWAVPKVKITILGGSDEQSQNVYNYYRTFVENSELMSLVDGEVMKRLTKFKHGGYVRSLLASEKSAHGPRPDILFLDEVCDADPRIIKGAMPQVLTAREMKIVATSTPHKYIHIFHDWWDSGEWDRHHWDAYKCPWIPRKNIEAQKKELTEDEIEIWLLGNFASLTGSVYRKDLLRKASSEIREIPKSTFGAVGVDWGYEHPTCIISGVLGEDGRVYVVDEVGIRHGDMEGINGTIKERCRMVNGDAYVDSSHIFNNQQLASTLSRDTVFSVIPLVYRAVKDGLIHNAKRFLELGRLVIDPSRTPKLIEQLFAYHYKEGTETPAKVNDDYHDAFINMLWAFRNVLSTETERIYDASELVDMGRGRGVNIFAPLRFK